ncbi:MAG: VTT domain-containing protein [Cyclobacteriaceae bacterium]
MIGKKLLLPTLVVAVIVIATFLLLPGLEAYFTDLLEGSRQHPGTYALLSGLVLCSDILLPVPSSIVMYTNGYVLGIGGGAALSMLAVMVSSLIGYGLGRFTSYGLRSADDAEAKSMIGRYGPLAILITRGIPILAESVTIVAAYNRMPLRPFLLLHLLGYLPVVLLYAACGSYGYNEQTFLLTFGASLLVAAGFWLIGRRISGFYSTHN